MRPPQQRDLLASHSAATREPPPRQVDLLTGKSTRAQYVLTTPITHNVEVFEPADITLVTSKKPRDARWAPPIGVLQRRAEAAV